MRVRVELLDMTCKATQFTEDIVTGGDELYVLSAFFADGADVKAGSTTPINIDAGQTKAFNPVDATGRPERMLFDADVPETATIQGALVARQSWFA